MYNSVMSYDYDNAFNYFSGHFDENKKVAKVEGGRECVYQNLILDAIVTNKETVAHSIVGLDIIGN